jgi:hypothetical protein
MLRLAANSPLRSNVKPLKIGKNSGFEFRRAPHRVDIFDTDQKSTTSGPRHCMAEQRRTRMPQMQAPVRARRETKDGRERHYRGPISGVGDLTGEA